MRRKTITDFLKTTRERFPAFEPVILLCMAGIVLALMAFAEITDDVLEGETHAFDKKILMMMRDGNNPQNPWGPPWVAEMVRDISGLGGIVILALVTFGAGLYLWMLRKKGAAVFLFVTVILGTLLSNLLKHGFGRPRPDLVPHGSYIFTNSFPSGHSMMAAIVYLSIGILLARAHASYRLKLYFIFTSILITLLIGVSRVYLGVHWPTDVLAGWLAGGVFAVMAYTLEWAWQEKYFSKIKALFKKQP